MTNRRPTLCVVAGPNGSGKTTTTIQLLNNEWAADSLYINPDNIAQEMFGDWNSPEAVLKAAEKATQMRYECLEQGRDFVFETVFSSPEKMEFLKKAKIPIDLRLSSNNLGLLREKGWLLRKKAGLFCIQFFRKKLRKGGRGVMRRFLRPSGSKNLGGENVKRDERNARPFII